MRTSWLRGVLVLALVLVPAKAPKPAFSGNVCGTVPANVVAAIPGVSPHCTNAQPVPGPGSTDYVGNWTGAPRLPGLQVTVASYTDKGLLELARHNLKQGLPGPPSSDKGPRRAGIRGQGCDGRRHPYRKRRLHRLYNPDRHPVTAKVPQVDRASGHRPGEEALARRGRRGELRQPRRPSDGQAASGGEVRRSVVSCAEGVIRNCPRRRTCEEGKIRMVRA